MIPVEDARALIYNVNFSLSQYQQLRLYLKDHLIDIPTRNEVDLFKKSLMCEYFVEATKTYCEFNFRFHISVLLGGRHIRQRRSLKTVERAKLTILGSVPLFTTVSMQAE